MKADKEKSVVIIPTDDYRNKVRSFLRQNNATMVNFSLDNFMSVMFENISRHRSLEEAKSSLLIMNPQVPKLYGLFKVHKPEIPIGAVVSYTSTPTYHLYRYLSRWFMSNTDYVSKYLRKKLH